MTIRRKASAVLGVILLSLFASCSSDRSGEQKVELPHDLSVADCSLRFGGKYFMFEGLSARSASEALEGQKDVSRMIVTELLRRGGDGAVDDRSACQLIFWTELSAQNEDLHSAYELAVIDRLDDPIRCRRAKHWARTVIERIEEFRVDALPGADPQLVERSIEGRRKQMEGSLQRQCAAL